MTVGKSLSGKMVIEGEAPAASLPEGATLASDTHERKRVFEGEAPQALPAEGATLAP